MRAAEGGTVTNPNLAHAHWVKSSYSGGEGGQCVELAQFPSHRCVAIRDSKNPDGGALIVSDDAFRRFLAHVRDEA
jgi:hypothetical protein